MQTKKLADSQSHCQELKVQLRKVLQDNTKLRCAFEDGELLVLESDVMSDMYIAYLVFLSTRVFLPLRLVVLANKRWRLSTQAWPRFVQ